MKSKESRKIQNFFMKQSKPKKKAVQASKDSEERRIPKRKRRRKKRIFELAVEGYILSCRSVSSLGDGYI